jgi:hypothetical protein
MTALDAIRKMTWKKMQVRCVLSCLISTVEDKTQQQQQRQQQQDFNDDDRNNLVQSSYLLFMCWRNNHKVSYRDSTGKVKCTLVQALRLFTGRTPHKGSRRIALLFHDHGTRRR